MPHQQPPPLTLPLKAIEPDDLPLVGGKAIGLARLHAAGLEVPPAFIITTYAYRQATDSLPAEPSEQDLLTISISQDLHEAIMTAYAQLGGGPVAVRSSATAEDLPGAAFAGQQDTILGVIGLDSLTNAVRTCWASLWGDRARSYRAHLGIAPGDVSIAVVVQRMVDPDYAGVMLTANPVSGARDEVIIESSPGLGEAVVSGLVTPDHTVLDATGRVLSRTSGSADTIITQSKGGGTRHSASGETPLAPLPDAKLQCIASIGRQIVASAGRPMDIEWATKGDHIFMLQARPMTALPPPPRSLSRLQRSMAAVILELLPRRPLPLELTGWIIPIVARRIERTYLGLTGTRVDSMALFPAQDGVLVELVPPTPQPTWRLPLAILHNLRRASRDPRDWSNDARAQKYYEECAYLDQQDLQSLSWRRLIDLLESVRATSDLLTDLRIDFQPALGVSILRAQILLTLIGLKRHLGDLLVSSDSKTRSANHALANIANSIRNDLELKRTLIELSPPEALERLLSAKNSRIPYMISEFMRQYGHRETGSLALIREPSWAEDPASVVAIMRALIASSSAEVSEPADDPLKALLEKPRVRRLGLGGLISKHIRKARAGLGAREDTHFAASLLMPPTRRIFVEVGRRLAALDCIDTPEDVWFLTWDQIQEIPDPDHYACAGKDLRHDVSNRKITSTELRASPLISPYTLAPPVAKSRVPDALVAGVGGGGGQASGMVRVIRGTQDFQALQRGDILVCTSTNPSWTPLFATAAAVVTDHGGIASHAAIVAREYGIPAVMGCGNATSKLTSGQRVRVDGNQGTVKVETGHGNG